MQHQKKILVTGSDGYIGIILTKLLKKRGYEVVGLDTHFYHDAQLYTDGVINNLTCIDRDTRLTTKKDLSGFAALIHLAELSNDPLGQINPKVTQEINHQASVRLAKTAKILGIEKFIYSSSCSVYGQGGDEYLTEESPTKPQTVYAECKARVENDVAGLADSGFSPTFLRNATAYGPSPRMRFDLVLNNLAGLAWCTKEIKLQSDGSPWRPLVHVLDICQAMVRVLQAPKKAVYNQIFNVGDSQENYRIRDIAQIVKETFPGCSVSYGKTDADQRCYKVSFEKIKNQLPGFKCQRNARIGAQELLTLFKSVALDRKTFSFRAYTRVEQLEYLKRTGQLDEKLFWR